MEIKVRRVWTVSGVRKVCVANDFYTKGDNEEYKDMLAKVASVTEPTYYDVYEIAKDITEHSVDGWTDIENTMFLLERDAVMTFFNVTE